MIKRLFLVVAAFASFATVGRAQSLTDAVRLANEPIGTGARTIAMGGTGVASVNDYSALDWNPAALTLLDYGEINLGIFYKGHNSTALFLGTSKDESITNPALSSFAYVAPVETDRGHLAFGLSFDRVRDYNATYSFSAVNSNSSLFDTKGFVNDPGFSSRNGTFSDYLSNLQQNNLAWEIYLTDPIGDTLNPSLKTPFGKGGLLQTGTVTEEGGLNALRFGAGIEVAENISLGATVNFFFGSYDYRRVYSETDVNHVLSGDTNFNGFQSAQIIDTRHQSQFGINLKVGLLANTLDQHLRFGFTFETPTAYAVDDQFQRTGKTFFNTITYSSLDPAQNPDINSLNPTIENSYTVTTPMKFGAGVAFTGGGATISAAVDYSDFSQLRYSDESADLSDLNDAARQNLGGVLNWKVGAEYVFTPAGIILRAGYGVNPSPYKSDPSTYSTKNISAGLGILLSKSAIAEITYRRSSYQTDHSVYNDVNLVGTSVSANVDTDTVVQNQILLSFSLRW